MKTVTFVVLILLGLIGTVLGTAAPLDAPRPTLSGRTVTAPPEPVPVTDPEPTPTVTPATTPIPTPTAAPAPERRTLAMTFTGDLLSHMPVVAQAAAYASADPESTARHDFGPMFTPIAARIAAADLSFCVLETPLSRDGSDLSGYPTFNAPPELADAIAATGWDSCSIASNHALDRGAAGVEATLDHLDRVGVEHAGTARSADEKAEPTLLEANGITVAHLSYTYGLNGFVLPADRPYLVNVTDADAVVDEARRAREAGADLVVVALQWGAEYRSDPDESQLRLARELAGSPDIDLIVGNHVHVVQPVEIVDGTPVVYGVGNLLSNQSDPSATQNGVVVTALAAGDDENGYEIAELTYTPTRVDRSDYTVVSLPEALAFADLEPGVRAVYEAAMASTTEAVNRLGADLELAPAPPWWPCLEDPAG